ncbi:hypothetical protein FQN57_006871 [Myotisia sp. PD_48]|nr:hypothetical protein FQN57_006871 [Myotisia sp. PD_48]
MGSFSPRKFILLSTPRTASNLFVKILSLDDQPSVVEGGRRGYFFIQTFESKLFDHKVAGEPIDAWPEDVKVGLKKLYQECSDNLQKEVQIAASQNKDMFFKEHVAWITDPVDESKLLHGEDSTTEEPWLVNVPSTIQDKTRSPLNRTIFPDSFWHGFHPTFLIRHPALAFPSLYRAAADLLGKEEVVNQCPFRIEMTYTPARLLFDWYNEHLDTSSKETNEPGINWPIVMDADDVIMEPEVLMRYSKALGFDSTKLKHEWKPVSAEDIAKQDEKSNRMLSTLNSSDGILKNKTAVGLDLAEEAKKWREEFGEEEGALLEGLVRDAMPDYEHLRARRLTPQ